MANTTTDKDKVTELKAFVIETLASMAEDIEVSRGFFLGFGSGDIDASPEFVSVRQNPDSPAALAYRKAYSIASKAGPKAETKDARRKLRKGEMARWAKLIDTVERNLRRAQSEAPHPYRSVREGNTLYLFPRS